MTQPQFTVVIPTYNRSELFPLAVQSVLDQTFDDYEVIVSDNCSTDNTPEVARSFTDRRVRYVRTPQHCPIADSWEFARSTARGELVIMLSDDDALVSGALEAFRTASEQHDADFLFSSIADYSDHTFRGKEPNSLICPAFSGTSRQVSTDEFVSSMCAFRPAFHLHPSAFVFARSVADTVARRTGRFFWTNGVEYSAWMSAAIVAKGIAYLDMPLTICGHTNKSWTSNFWFYNPGKEQIKKLTKDVDQGHRHTPLQNLTMTNLMAEGILLAMSQFRDELSRYTFDEVQYLQSLVGELRRRRAMGVDVSSELDEALSYARKYPELHRQLVSPVKEPGSMKAMLKSALVALGARAVKRRFDALRLARDLERGPVRSGFFARGRDFRFNDIRECARFLQRALGSLVSVVSSCPEITVGVL